MRGWHRPRTTVEQCLRLTVRHLTRSPLLLPGGPRFGYTSWGTLTAGCELVGEGEQKALRLTYDRGGPVVCDVPLLTTTPRLGGVRWWYGCPTCGRRVCKLFCLPLGSCLAAGAATT